MDENKASLSFLKRVKLVTFVLKILYLLTFMALLIFIFQTNQPELKTKLFYYLMVIFWFGGMTIYVDKTLKGIINKADEK